jgi:FKBP-type peptidyl-prolyl cis-trans isomerase SlyD
MIAASSLAGTSEGADKSGKEEKVVGDDSVVKVHYTLTVEGNVVDSSKQGEPFQFQMGGDQVIPGFEKGVMGMKTGEKKSFDVTPEDGYGQEDQRGFQEVPRSQLPKEIVPEAGMTLYGSGPDGKPVPVRISEVKEDVVVINLNHPLAGKTLNFEIEVLDVE